jgi:hypothetical protein
MSAETMPVPVALSPVEQALVAEVAAWAQRAQAEMQASANARLAVVLDAHGLSGQAATFHHDNGTWSLLVTVPVETRPQLVAEDAA